MHAAGLNVQSEAALEPSFLPHPTHGDYGPGPSGPNSREQIDHLSVCSLFSQVSSML